MSTTIFGSVLPAIIKSPLGSSLTISNFKRTSLFSASSAEREVVINWLSSTFSFFTISSLFGMPKKAPKPN